MALMEDTHSNSDSDDESVVEEIEVLSNLSHNELIVMLNELLNKNHKIS